MKLFKYTSVLALAVALTFSACTKIDDIAPEGGTVISSQLQQVTTAVPERADAVFSGMYTKLGDPLSFGKFSSSRADDFGFIMMAYSNDVEAADIVLADNGYNWFSVCCELTSRNANYANPYIRYRGCYDEIGRAHDVMNAYGEITADTPDNIKFKVAQAYAVRAFCYINLAPYYQFRYVDHQNDPCVPIVTLEEVDYTHNPRATVKEVYDLIISDLSYAIANLEGYNRGTDKSKIDQQVAYALRARAYLYMGEYAKAAEDAEKAIVGYEASSIAQCSKPAFYDISESNWLWGYDMTPAVAQRFPYATASSWIRSFSGDGYAGGAGVYSRINTLLYDKISESDVRKGWWVDADLYSPLLDGLTFMNLKGQEIATKAIDNVKLVFDPYTNVKFGMNSIGGTTNDDDWPFVRVEEMILTAAEGYAMSGNEAKAKELLIDFVKNHRDPQYVIPGSRSLQDEIWFQRRVELWGEGLANADTRRLNKPFVRFHDDNKGNMPEAFRFNMPADDGWLLMRFCTDETNTNFSIVDNQGGSLPVQDQHGDLRDGVTD